MNATWTWVGQLPRDIREALAANARTKIAFATSPEDAALLARHFSPHLSDHDLANLGAFQAACRPSIGGAHGPAFTFRTEPLASAIEGRARAVRGASATSFAVPRAKVEAEIRQRLHRWGSDR